jgi:glutamate-ammonia-ligase adenylyltransferase
VTEFVAAEDWELRARAVRAASQSLGEFLDQDEAASSLLGAADLPSPVAYAETLSRAVAEDGIRGLRLTQRRFLVQIAAQDLTRYISLERVGLALSDLADACLQASLEFAGAPGELSVVAMGKLGARELNYVSDIDVMFVTRGDLTRATRAAEELLRGLGEQVPEGRAYAIDAALRPEGKAGPLVRSAESYLEYYRRWAQSWELQALLKARHAAGDPASGELLVEQTRGMVFPEEVTPDRIASIRKMKERVEEHTMRRARRNRGRESFDVKLGPGGIRDIEFSVQLLQLVHGGTDENVRAPSTIGALLALTEGGYIADDDAAGLSVAYRWLRNVEHRLQLRRERRVRVLPRDDAARTDIAYAMGFHDSPPQSALERFDASHRAVLADVRGRFEKLFYRPMIEALADRGAGRLSGEALRGRLRFLGFRDVERAERTLTGLVSGTSRRAKLVRVLTPALMRWLSTTPAPDAGLFAFLRLSETLGDRIDALGMLRDNPPGLEFLARVLGSGRWPGDVLRSVPEELQTIADPRGPGLPKGRGRLVREARASLQWREPGRRLDGLRRFKRREMLRVAFCDLAATADVEVVGAGLADLADACLEAALDPHEDQPFAVIGMGKLGARELNYSSDIDVMFVHSGDPKDAERVAESVMRSIGEVTPEGQAFRIDAGLRPEGKSGPLARSLESFLEYYERWAKPWEHQALIKARGAAGDQDVAARLVDATRAMAFPPRLASDVLAEIRHLKARMERERIPRGTRPRQHLKMGPGGMADIEFSAQLLQLRYGSEVEELRAGSTLGALRAAKVAGLLEPRDSQWLEEAYRFLLMVRNRLFFLNARPLDIMPSRPEDLEALGIALGYRDQPRQEIGEDHLRFTRRARRVAERLIYG